MDQAWHTDAIDRSAPEVPGSDQPLDGTRVLVVEDHADTARLLTILLERWGMSVMTADSVAGALQLAAQHPFDILVCDIGLADGSGVDVMRRLERRVPGVMLSGRSDDDEVRAGIAAGFSAHLLKPVEFDALRRALLKLVSSTADAPPR